MCREPGGSDFAIEALAKSCKDLGSVGVEWAWFWR